MGMLSDFLQKDLRRFAEGLSLHFVFFYNYYLIFGKPQEHYRHVQGR